MTSTPDRKPSVVLLANSFPFGDWEPYLVPEIDALAEDFDLSIVALSVRKDQRETRRPVPNGVRVLPIHLLPTASYVALGPIALATPEFLSEFGKAIRGGKQAAKSIVYTAKIWTRSKLEAKQISKFIRANGLDSNPNLIFYAYRMEYQAYLATLLKREFPHARIIIRGHGSDLEVGHRPNKRVPFRETAFATADKLVTISKYNLEYLQKRYPKYKNKMVVSYLGTYDHGVAKWSNSSDEVRLLSISNMEPLKRLPMMAQAIGTFARLNPDVKVVWTHYGEGSQFEDLRHQTAQLPSTVTINLAGQVSNEQLFDQLHDSEYDLLLNTSTREGLPVSMMEAMSLGIPVIGTAVGGVPEIVKHGYNGWLIDDSDIVATLSKLIGQYVSMEEPAKRQLRKNARQTWERHFSAKSAFSRFSQLVKELCQE